MWKYVQNTGKIYNQAGSYFAHGYSGGNEGNNPEGVNNHDMQNVPDIGPTPCGKYTLGTVVMESRLGPFAIPLIPDPSNEMFGRSDFFMHGDTIPNGKASKGCMIMPRSVREHIYYSDDKEIEVVYEPDDQAV